MFIPTFYTTTLDMPMRFTGALRHLTWRNLQWLHYRPPSLLMHNFTPNLHPFQVRSCHYHVQPTHNNWQQQGPQRYLYLFLLGFLGLFKHEEDGEQVPPSIKRKLLKAQRALRNEDYREAERAYHDALKLLASSKYASAQPYLEARAVTLDKMANMYLEQNQLEEAEANFKETLRTMMAAGVTKESDAVIEISLKLAKIYTNQGRYELAAAGFEWCTEVAEKSWATSESTESLALWGMCLHGKGQYHLAVRESSEAVVVFCEALRIAKKVYGPAHLQVAVLHNDLATALEMAGEYVEAERHVTKSLETVGSVGGGNIAEHLATFYYNLGTILSRQGKTSAALDAYSKARQHAARLQDGTLHNQIKKTMQGL